MLRRAAKIAVDDEDPLSGARHLDTEVRGDGGLAHASLTASDQDERGLDDAAHAILPRRATSATKYRAVEFANN